MRHDLRTLINTLLLSFLLAVAFRAEERQADPSYARQSNVILGVLEEHPGMHTGEPNFWRVRAVFEKEGSEWKAFPNPCTDVPCLRALPKSYPTEVNWIIAFDGRNLGQITARTPPEFRGYDSVGCQEITSSGPIPTVGNRSIENSGFLFSPAYRPLVGVSKPYFKDPQHWKPSQLSTEPVSNIREQFRRKFPKVTNCRNPYENALKPWPYQDKDIKIGKAYSSNEDRSVAELHLSGWACDGPQEDGSPFLTQWYTISPTGEVRLLGSEMWLLDAGDYDGDGRSEVLFRIDGYNKGGYRLFYRDFSKSAEFLFNYH